MASKSPLPGPEAGWGEIQRFALTFDGYTHAGSVERCGEIANAAAERFAQGKGLFDSLDDLRTCLFFEQRRWRHFAEDPDEETMRYIRALLEAVREKVRAREDTV